MTVTIEIDMPERSTLSGAAIATAVRQAISRDFADVDLDDTRVGANEGKLMSPNGHTVGTWAVRRSGAAALAEAEIQHGFLTLAQVGAMGADPETRLTPVLVRCGGGRFVAAAQDVRHFVDMIEFGGGDYVRDYSLPVGWKAAK